MAGYLVEIASGEPLDRYITENILEPLEMNHSSYGLTKSLLPSMAKPYLNLFGQYFEREYTLLSDHPAGSICASASDMANFMLAHLNNGEFNGKRILNSDTAARMHTHQYPEDGRLAGFTLSDNRPQGVSNIAAVPFDMDADAIKAGIPIRNMGTPIF